MIDRQRTRIVLAAGILITAHLWAGACGPVSAEEVIGLTAPGSTIGSQPNVTAGVAAALRATRQRLRLTRMEQVGPRGADLLTAGWQIEDREEIAVASATRALLDRLTGDGRRNLRLVHFAGQVTHLVDTPNRWLCRLTGADRAHLNLQRRRVSFTWLVSW